MSMSPDDKVLCQHRKSWRQRPVVSGNDMRGVADWAQKKLQYSVPMLGRISSETLVVSSSVYL